MLTTSLCRRLQLRVPVVQAPIGSAASPQLAAAVSDAGALGMLAGTWLSQRALRERIRRVRQSTDRPFGVNLVLDFPVAGQLGACLAEGVGIVSTFWGDPATVHDRIHAMGAVHLHSVGSVDEARRAVDAGVDVLVAQVPGRLTRPGEGEVVAVDVAGRSHVRYEDLIPLPGMRGHLPAMPA